MVAWEVVALVGVGLAVAGAFAWSVWHHADEVTGSADASARER